MSKLIDPVDDLVIRRFATLYGPPTTDDAPAFIAEYHEALDGTDPDILRQAISVVVKRQTVPAWPVVGECVAAVNAAAQRRAAERGRERREAEPPRRQPTAEEKARVDALVKAMAAKLRGHRDSNPKATMSTEEWARGAKPAWDERMATSATARQLAMPKGWRG